MSASVDPGGPSPLGFAGLLLSYRHAAGLTQQELAARAGLGERTVRELERGRVLRPQRTSVELLADALGLSGAARDRFVRASRERSVAPAGAALPATADRAPAGVDDPGGPAGAGGEPQEPDGRPTGALALPPPVPLVGRDVDLRALDDLLRSADMVTILGPGGVGKTALTIAALHRVMHRFPAGVAGITVTDSSPAPDILATVAAVFEVSRPSDLPARIAGGPALLVVDGADRSPTAVSSVVAWLRRSVPSLRLLANARRPLAVPTGVEYRLSALPVPPRGTRADLRTVASYPAAGLFLQRLRQVRREPLDAEDAPVLAELVRRLAGLPLPIELAAARGRVLELPEILQRYGAQPVTPLRKGRTGRPEAPPRQHDRAAEHSAGITVYAAVAVSYRLLDKRAQAALRRLSVFRGRWSLELAGALLDEPNVEALLDRLVGLGLVSVRPGTDLRFRLLDAVRDFAVHQCAAAGELAAVRGRHAAVFAELAARTAAELAGPDMPGALSRLSHARADLRAALDDATEYDPPTALRLAEVLYPWLRYQGREREARARLRALLDDPRTGRAPEPLLARVRTLLAPDDLDALGVRPAPQPGRTRVNPARADGPTPRGGP